MADVFVSYSRRDGGFVRELHVFLSKAGRDVWVDWEDIPAASDWERDISDNIDEAESFVFVVSTSSLASEYCAAEFRHAQERGKRIVPIACDQANPEAAPPGLRQLNWIWCREGDDRGGAFARLSSALDTDLDWARAHTRLLVRAVDWDTRQDNSLLLRGRDLARAELDLAANAAKEPTPTELQQRYVLASRRAASRRQRAVLGAVTGALAVSVGLGVVALLQRNTANDRTRITRSQALAAQATSNLTLRTDTSALLAIEALRAKSTTEARSAAVGVVEQTNGVRGIIPSEARESAEDVEFASASGSLVSAGNNRVAVWDRQRRLVRSFRKDGVIIAATSPTGRTIAAADGDGNFTLWRDGEVVPTPDDLSIAAVAFAGDGMMATGGFDDSVVLWDLRSGRRRTLASARDTIDIPGVAFSADRRHLTVVDERWSRTWDLATGVTTRHATPGRPDSVVLGAGGRVAALSYASGEKSLPTESPRTLIVWDVARDRRVSRLTLPKGIAHVAFDRRGRRLALATGDGQVELRSVGGSQARPTARSVQGRAVRVQFSPDGMTLAAGGDGGAITLLDLRPGHSLDKRVELAPAPSNPFGSPTLDSFVASTGGNAIAWSDGERLGLWIPGEGRWRMYRNPVDVQTLAASERGVVVGGYDGVFAWALDGGRPFKHIPYADDTVSVALGRDLLATGGDADSGRVRLFTPSGRRLGNPVGLDREVLWAVAIRPDEDIVASGGFDRRIGLWRVVGVGDSRHLEAADPPVVDAAGNVVTIDFSPDGKLAAAGTWEGDVRLWDARTWAPLLNSYSATTRIAHVAFAPDSRTLAVADHGGEVALWDTTSGQQLGQPLTTNGDGPSGVAFTLDGHLVTGDASGLTIWSDLVWRQDESALERRLCSVVSRNLTRQEWRQFVGGPYKRTCPQWPTGQGV